MFTDNVVRSLSCKARANAMQYVILSAIVSCSVLYFPLSAGFLRMPSCAEPSAFTLFLPRKKPCMANLLPRNRAPFTG